MPDFEMGLFLSKIVSTSNTEMSQPHSLEELLREFNHVSIRPDTDVEALIESKMWPRKFREYLLKRDLADLDLALKFLVLTQPLAARAASEPNNNGKSRSKTRSKKDFFDRTVVLAKMSAYFDEESEDQLSLSNAQLFEALCEASSRLSRGGEVVERDVSLVSKARQDPDVWVNGLEPKFMKFIEQTSTVACILSIL